VHIRENTTDDVVTQNVYDVGKSRESHRDRRGIYTWKCRLAGRAFYPEL